MRLLYTGERWIACSAWWWRLPAWFIVRSPLMWYRHCYVVQAGRLSLCLAWGRRKVVS